MGKGKEKETLTPEERLQAALVSENEQPYKVPENWCWTRIVKLCSLSNGKAFKPTDWSKTGIPIVRIQNLNNPEAEYNLYSGTVEDKFRLCGGELLFAWSGTPGTSFGAHIWWGKEAALNQHIFRVDFDEKYINKVYFKYAINQQLDMLISVAHGGAGLQHVTKGVFEATPIPIPPFAEQQRIVPQSYQMQLIPLTGTITNASLIEDARTTDATHTPHGDEKHKALRLCVKAHGLRAFVLSEKKFSVIPENLLLFDD